MCLLYGLARFLYFRSYGMAQRCVRNALVAPGHTLSASCVCTMCVQSSVFLLVILFYEGPEFKCYDFVFVCPTVVEFYFAFVIAHINISGTFLLFFSLVYPRRSVLRQKSNKTSRIFFFVFKNENRMSKILSTGYTNLISGMASVRARLHTPFMHTQHVYPRNDNSYPCATAQNTSEFPTTLHFSFHHYNNNDAL